VPINTHLTSDRFGIVLECTGMVDGDELVEANATVSACASCRYQLWLFAEGAHVVADAEAVHRLAIQDSNIPSWSSLEKIAVVGQHRSVLDLTRIYELYSKAWVGRHRDFEVRHFMELASARDWLAVEIDRPPGQSR